MSSVAPGSSTLHRSYRGSPSAAPSLLSYSILPLPVRTLYCTPVRGTFIKHTCHLTLLCHLKGLRECIGLFSAYHTQGYMPRIQKSGGQRYSTGACSSNPFQTEALPSKPSATFEIRGTATTSSGLIHFHVLQTERRFSKEEWIYRR